MYWSSGVFYLFVTSKKERTASKTNRLTTTKWEKMLAQQEEEALDIAVTHIPPVTLYSLRAHTCVCLCISKAMPSRQEDYALRPYTWKKSSKIPLSMVNNTAALLLILKSSLCMFLETVMIKQMCVRCVFLLFSGKEVTDHHKCNVEAIILERIRRFCFQYIIYIFFKFSNFISLLSFL